jgi:phage shock protein C
MVAGIRAGIAGYSGLDVTLVRVMVTLVSVITGGTTALAYLAAWLVIPGEGEKISIAMINTMRQRDPGLVILPAHDLAAASRLAQATGQVPALATV